MFLTAALLGLLALLLTFFPLRAAGAHDDIGDSFAMPRDPTSLEELERIVTRMANRENRWSVYERFGKELGVTLQPNEIWLLGPLGETHHELSRESMSSAWRADPKGIRCSLDALVAAGYVSWTNNRPHLTDAGDRLHRQIVERRRSSFAKLLGAWAPETHADAKVMLERLAHSYIAEAPARR